mmetsp:Transcript_13469/g.53985  ORF Transcript_13469/g.53985 Transcript_13469/m.53985 type:complete len:82 (+) Transcript_13469:2980-3225(+)
MTFVHLANASVLTLQVIDEPALLGLAQLHQLRGRVGRGELQGYAWLLYEGSRNTVNERLRILEQYSGMLFGPQALSVPSRS